MHEQTASTIRELALNETVFQQCRVFNHAT